MQWGYNTLGSTPWGSESVQEVQTFGEYFEQDAWERDNIGSRAAESHADSVAEWSGDGSVGTTTPSFTQQIAEGTAQLNLFTSMSADGVLQDPVSIDFTADDTAYYTIDVTTAEGALIGTLTTVVSGNYDANRSEASKLSFVVPRSEPLVASLRFPNKLVLRERFGLVLDRFAFKGYTEFSEGEGLFVGIVGLSLLSQLRREQVLYYSKEATVAEHVANLFVDQLQSPSIVVGNIDELIGSTSMSLELEATTVLDALHRIHAQLPPDIAGHFYVSANHTMNWKVAIGDDVPPIVSGRNLRGAKWEYDDSELVTRLTLVGEGQDELHRPSVTVTQNTETYGIVPMLKIDRRILKEETLQAKADAIIAAFSTPKINFEIDVLDLAKADLPTYWQYGDYYVGARHRIEAPEQGLSQEMTIHGLTYDLSDPVPVKVRSGNRSNSLSDVVRGMDSRIPSSTNVNKGDQYANISRIYDGTEHDDVDEDGNPTAQGLEDLELRDGDLAYRVGDTDTDNTLRMRQETDSARWVEMVPMYVAETEAQLPNDDKVPQVALGRVTTTTGDNDAGDIFKRNGTNDGWEEINSGDDWQIYTANSVEELPDGVAATSFGRVVSGDGRGAMYVRSQFNNKWVSFTHWSNWDEA